MSFLAPAAFFLGLTLPIIVALYLLKLRRTDQRVSSTYLWRRMVRDVEANAPWQRLRWNLLMVLQLLILILLILALARPFTWQEGVGSQSVILILDNSASMQATDVGPSRLEAARNTALDLIANLPEGARITVIAAGDKAQVLLSSSQDRRQAQMAVESIRPANGSSQMTVALQLASAIASRQADTEVVVLSDGRVELPERLVLNGTLRYLPIGTDAGNQAISLLSLESDATGSTLHAFAQVTNYSDQPARRRLTIYADGNVVNAVEVDLPANGQQAVPLFDLPPLTAVVEARMDAGDALALDDRAMAVRVGASRRQVLLVSEGNLFLRTALRLLPGVSLTEAVPADTLTYDPAFDLVIFDRFVPAGDLPRNHLLFIAPPASTALFTVSGTVDAPRLRPIAADHPLLQYTLLGEVNVLDAVVLPLPEWAEAVVAGDVSGGESHPMIFYGKPEGRRVAVIAFDLRHSDLPLDVSFPILLNNLVNWLVSENRPSAGIPSQLAPGESLSFAPAGGSERAVITRPDGTSVTLVADENGMVSFGDTGQLGLYTIRMGEEISAFAVNLFSPQESTLKPLDTLSGITSTGSGEAVEQQARREWWRLLALAGLGVLLAEWLLYNRAGLARLRAMITNQKGERGLRLRRTPR